MTHARYMVVVSPAISTSKDAQNVMSQHKFKDVCYCSWANSCSMEGSRDLRIIVITKTMILTSQTKIKPQVTSKVHGSNHAL